MKGFCKTALSHDKAVVSVFKKTKLKNRISIDEQCKYTNIPRIDKKNTALSLDKAAPSSE